MMNRLGIQQKILLLVLAVNIALSAILAVTMYRHERAAFLRGIDEKLYSGATATAEIFQGGGYHAEITSRESVPPGQYASYTGRLTDLARKNNFVYLYTYMEVNGQIVTTSTSANLKTGEVVPFFQPYAAPDSLRRALAERRPFFAEYSDEFCDCRSAFVPVEMPNGKVFVAGADVSIGFIREMLNSNLRKVILLSTVVSAFFVLLSVVFARRLARPIGELAGLTRSLDQTAFSLTPGQQGWLQAVSERQRDEVGDLASAFIHMDATLKQYIADLRKTTAAKERIESELNIARSIQDSFLHKLFPPFPDRREFDLYATLEPAKEVGGDLYDFLLIGDELYFCVGDVSDKGVPAALLMVVTQTLMRAAAQQLPGMDPAAMLTKVNADIFEKNETLMFVTMFCGVLNIRTGLLRFSNAGHNPPLIRRAGGSVEWLKLPPGIVLGVSPEQDYRTLSTTLEPGDTLVAYTDGVPEAKNPASKLFSNNALKDAIEAHPGTPPQIVKALMATVKAHAAGAPQSDDITVLALSLGRRAPEAAQ